jgi:hypothetical protein
VTVPAPPPSSSLPGLRYLRWKYSPTRFINTRGLREGLYGRNTVWLGIFIVFRVLVAVKRASTRSVERVSVDALKPGEGLVIRTFPVRNGKERARLSRGG